MIKYGNREAIVLHYAWYHAKFNLFDLKRFDWITANEISMEDLWIEVDCYPLDPLRTESLVHLVWNFAAPACNLSAFKSHQCTRNDKFIHWNSILLVCKWKILLEREAMKLIFHRTLHVDTLNIVFVLVKLLRLSYIFHFPTFIQGSNETFPLAII